VKTLLSLLLLLALGLELAAQAPATNPPLAIPQRPTRATNAPVPGPPARVGPATATPAAPVFPSVPAPAAAQQPRPFTPSIPGAAPAPPGPGTSINAGPGGTGAAGSQGGTNFMRNAASFSTNAAGEKILKSGAIKFQSAPLEQVLEIYADLIGRTILRPSALPAAPITLKTQSDLTLKEAKEALDSVLSLNGISTILVGEKFVTIVPTSQIQQEAAAFNSDTNAVSNLPEAGQYTTKIVKLKAARPSEVVPAIQPFGKVQNGILPLDGNGILILRDNAANIKRMLEVIAQIDEAIPYEEELEVLPIRFALASEIAGVLSSLTGGGGGVATTGARTGGRPGRMGSSPGGTLRNTPFGSTPGVGSPGSYPGGVGTVNPGGISSGINNPGGINVTPGAASTDFASRLRATIQNAVRPGGGAGASPLFGEAKIIPDERTNSLLIFGTTNEIAEVKKVVAKLDLVQAQVLIESIIMEVSLDNSKQFGVSTAHTPPEDYRIGRLKGQTAGGINNGQFPAGSFLTQATNLFPGSFPSGFTHYQTLGANWDVAVQAIATDATVNVLSRPRIQTFHASEASLFVGDTVPYVTGTISDINGGARSQYQQTQVGITLSVLPLVNPDGLVVMDIQQNIEQLGTPTVIDNNSVPTTTKRQTSAKVAVMDGETIMLGGFISSSKTSGKSGVPYLKDIPYLGALFRSKNDTSKRVELIVLMRPTVLKTPQLAALTATEERDKMAGVKRAEMQILEDERRMANENKEEMKRLQLQDENRLLKEAYEAEKARLKTLDNKKP
jgi:general secretion pathway protein D